MKRAKHIVYENERVLKAIAGLKKDDLKELGDAMTQSHNSSRDDFGNSCKELDQMRECAEGLEGFLGGRLMGGGFGGCTINLVEEVHAKAFSEQLALKYKEATGTEPTMLECLPGNGAFGEQLAPSE